MQYLSKNTCQKGLPTHTDPLMLQTEVCYMADQSKLISRHVQPTHYLSQSWLAEKLLAFSVDKSTRLVIEQFYSYLQMAYKFVIKAHESSHVPEGISDKKHILIKKSFTFKWLRGSCQQFSLIENHTQVVWVHL